MKICHSKIILDDADKHLLDEHSFSDNGKGYPTGNINKKRVKLHHLILPAKKGFDVDHINRNKYDNRRANLRYVTRSQNKMNGAKHENNTSGFRGVSWDKEVKKWKAKICINYKQVSIGHFDDIEDAARAYKNAAVKLFQEFLGEL